MENNNTIPKCPPLRFPEFTDEWKQTTLGESYPLTMGQSPSSLFYNTNQKGLPLIQGAADMQGGRTIIRFYSLEGSKSAQQGDIILSVRAPVGRVVLTDFDCFIGRGVCAISSRNKYPFYFLQSYEKSWSKLASGSTFDSITGKEVSTLPISLPSLLEQQKIATFLSLLDERIEAQRQIIKERKAEKKALLHQLFSQSIRFPGFSDKWKQTTLGKICQVVGGGTPSTGIDKYWGGNIPWFTPSEIQKKYIGDSERTITEEGLSNSGARLLPKGAILLTTRATVGECSISTNPCCTNQGFQSLIINPNTSTTEFIYQKVQTLRNEFLIRANGSTFKEITAQEIRGIHMFIPTLEEQSKIADFLSLLDTQIEVEEELLQKYEEQKKYLLRTMFI